MRPKVAARLLQEKRIDALLGAPGLDLDAGEMIAGAPLVPVGIDADGAEDLPTLLVHRGDHLPPPFLQVAEIVEKGLADRKLAFARAGDERDGPDIHERAL